MAMVEVELHIFEADELISELNARGLLLEDECALLRNRDKVPRRWTALKTIVRQYDVDEFQSALDAARRRDRAECAIRLARVFPEFRLLEAS